MDLQKLKTDQKKEQEGVRVHLGDAVLIIARLHNAKQRADFEARIRPYRGNVPEDINRRLFLESVAEHVLLGWENVTMNGSPFPYSKENAKAALEIPDFSDFVLTHARDAELFREEQRSGAADAVVKN
jgi:hypothetical protein